MDLEHFNRKAKEEKAQTAKLFKQFKKMRPKHLDQEFHRCHDEVFAEIDCLSCGNCCKTAGPRLIQKDIDRLAKHLRMKNGDFMDRYVKVDEDGDWIFNSLPCPFLGSDNYCSVYESRPKACRDYPHTDRNKMHQILRLTEKNANLCPAVFEISRRISPT